jgi:hypothetical protein
MLNISNSSARSLCLVVVAILSGSSYAAENPKPETQLKCPQAPCANTSTGEDPSVIDLREADRRDKALREGADDRARWSSIRLYSDTKEKEKLNVVLVASANFKMQLTPKSGVVRFSSPQKTVAFRIASGEGAIGDVCPRYNLKVVQADADHAVIRKICPRYEYGGNRSHMSTEYLLFDMRTSVMRSIWFAARSSKDAPFPDAKPPISITKLANGYKVNWQGDFPNDNSPEHMTISNAYTREKTPSGIGLVCTNLLADKESGLEDGMCEGRELERVGKSEQ